MAETVTTSSRRGRWSSRSVKLAVVAVVVLAAISFLSFMTIKGASSLFLNVSELNARAAEASTKQVQVMGKVLISTVEQDKEEGLMRFQLTDGKETVPVIYRGGVTSQFYKTDSDVVVEGRLRSDGVFEASNLISRHASRFEAERR